MPEQSVAPLLPKKRGRPKKNKMAFLTAPEKRKVGRPKVFFWRNYEKQMMDLFKQGCSIKEIASKIGYTREFLQREMVKDTEFGHFVELGKEQSEAWWVANGRENLENRQFNSHLYSLMMMNLHNWNNKQRIEAEGSVKIDLPNGLIDTLVDKIVDEE